MPARIVAVALALLSLSTPLLAQSLSIDDVSQAEGNAGQTSFTFTVTLTPAAGSTVTVDWQTFDSTASFLSDYVAGAGTLTFDPGVTSLPIVVAVNGDTTPEPDETFSVRLTNASGASIADPAGVGTILDDEVQASIGPDTSHPEGDTGLTNFDFAVTLSAPYSLTVSVDWMTSDNTAHAPADYNGASGTVTFAPGETSKPVTVQAIGDTLFETDEDFFVLLTSAVNATIADASTTATILNDDVNYTLSMGADITHLEGNLGFTNFDFTVTLSPASTQTVTVNWATSDGTATAPSDYLAGSGTLTFMPGETSQPITVQAIGDTVLESTQDFTVTLSGAVGATITDGVAIGYIANDDVGIWITPDTSHSEGSIGFTNFDFSITLTATYPLPISVNWATMNGTALAADNDYVPGSGTVTFSPGEVSKPITVQAVGDLKNEINETFSVLLSGAVNATIVDGTVVGTIVNDDTTSSIGLSYYSLMEGNGGLTSFSFQADLSGPSMDVVSVSYATSDGSATAGSDYTGISGVLSFDRGETSKVLNVDVRGDNVHEGDETFFVFLSDPVNCTIENDYATGTIQDDDPLELSIDDVDQMEGDAATSDFTFMLVLSNPSDLAASVDYRLTPISASEGADYMPGSGTIVFPPGTTSLPLQVAVVGETDHEIDETFTVDLHSPSVLSIVDAQGLGTILDDDPECTPGPVPVQDLSVSVVGGGTDLQFDWRDTAGSVAYDLYESGSPFEPFLGPAGSSTSGAAGLRIPLPAGDRFYLLTSTNPDCGEGPLHLCAHDVCDAGVRLDSGCDICAATVCAADPSCCTSQWSASCVAQVATLCGMTCN